MSKCCLTDYSGHFVISTYLHLVCIYWIVLCRIINIFRYWYAENLTRKLILKSEAAVPKVFLKMGKRGQKMLLFCYYLLFQRFKGRLMIDLNLATLIYIICLYIWNSLFIDYILNSKISILTKRISSRRRLFTPTTLFVERIRTFFTFLVLSTFRIWIYLFDFI